MNRLRRILIGLAIGVALFGCAGLEPGFETPTVGVRSFRALPSEGVAPKFEIGLHIVNPNRSALKLEGVVYSVFLDGQKVLTGASGDLPVIAPYGEGDVTVVGTVDLLGSINLFAGLMKQSKDSFPYELDVQLDIGKLRPRIHVQQKGEISLKGGTR